MGQVSEDTVDIVETSVSVEENDTMNVDDTNNAVTTSVNEVVAEVSVSTEDSCDTMKVDAVNDDASSVNKRLKKTTFDTNENDAVDYGDGDVASASEAMPLDSPQQGQVITEEDIAKLQRIVDVVKELGSKISQTHNDDDDEEGAIEEDDVPFERLPDVEVDTNIVHVLNIPPEMDIDFLVGEMATMPEVVHHCFPLKSTEIKINFASVVVAKEAKRMLDSIRIHNRTIQAVLSTPDEVKPVQAPMPSPPAVGNALIPPMFMMQHSSNRRGTPPMPRVQPGYPIPPYPPGMILQSSARKIPHHNTMPPMPLLPPPRYNEGQEIHGLYPTNIQTPLHAYPYEPHMKMVFGRNVSKRDGKSLYEILEPIPPVCNWSPDQTLEEQQRGYDILHAEYGVTNRYLILGGLPESARRSVGAACEWLEDYTKSKVDVEICEMANYAADMGLKDNRFLHLTFQRRSDCTDLYMLLTARHPEIVCKYAAPRKAFDTLWVGNITDILSYCRDQFDFRDMCAQLGDMKQFRFLAEKSCFFITYMNTEDAVKARNRLLGLSFTPIKTLALNVDFTVDMVPRLQKRPRQEIPESKGRDRDDYSQRLGERLLSALQRRSDGDVVLRQLLDGREGDSVNLFPRSNHRSYPPRNYEGRHGDYSRPPRDATYERSTWSRPRKRQNHMADTSPEYYRHRRHDNMRYDDHVDNHISTKREYEHERNLQRTASPPAPPPVQPMEERVAEPPAEPSAAKAKDSHMIMCDLLKRGKPICRVSALFIRGDMSHRLPQTLDVNQRANPERLANYMQKKPELSLWQLGADSSEDSIQYDGLCDYLISKNRVALVQEGPYEIYIVPPSDTFPLASTLPDTQFMYAYVLPKGS